MKAQSKCWESWPLIITLSLMGIETVSLSGCGKAMSTPAQVQMEEVIKKEALDETARVEVESQTLDPLPLDLINGDVLWTQGITIARNRYRNVGSEAVRIWVHAPASTFELRSKLHTLRRSNPGSPSAYRNYKSSVIFDEVVFSRNSSTLKKMAAGSAGFFDLKPGESVDINWRVHAPANVKLCQISLSFHAVLTGYNRGTIDWVSNWQAVSIDGRLSDEIRLSNPDLQTFSIDQTTPFLTQDEPVFLANGDWQPEPDEDIATCSGLQLNNGNSNL